MAKSSEQKKSILHGPPPAPGSFEHVEALIRALDSEKAKGDAFENLCLHFLQEAPQYAGRFKNVWLWNDWPGRWGPDKGIDLVAETTDGLLWAIQSKAIHSDRAIPKRELDSFLSESNRPDFAYRLLIATTDDIGRNALDTIDGQEKDVGRVLRGDLINADLKWPDTLGRKPKAQPKKRPRPHQKLAIRDVVKGFSKHDRGKLIMACGTGKTLVALWIAERLKSQRTLVLVPSLSLVSQTLAEWGRNSKQPFDYLVICSDETVARGEDHAVTSTSELGVPVTTDVESIGSFLRRRHARPVVVFCTYQSSERIAAAQEAKTPRFDLVLADEAHRCTGQVDGLFSTVLDEAKIKAKQRLFMTATPRYFTGRVQKKAEEQEYELASMDDEARFGPEFHTLKFDDAIENDLLTDYQVVVIGVTDAEAREWAEEARLVRGEEGLITDARTLASQIGLAKAMRKHKLRRIITFHSSVAKAKRFADESVPDSLPGVISRMSKASRPAGKLWASHISGHTSAGKRRTLLSNLGNLPKGARGMISNCACLGEGVDVPALDGVAFIDPKRSTVDIIQAVGRVIRKADDKRIGTIVIPVFMDDSEDAEQALSSSAFEPVWRVVRALRAHDGQLADELDALRLKLGGQSPYGGKVRLPKKIKVDVPTLLPQDFEQAFHVRTIEKSTLRQYRPFEQAINFAHKLALRSQTDWFSYCKGELPGKPPKPKDIPQKPSRTYKDRGWVNWGDWLGTGSVAHFLREYLPFAAARAFVHGLELQSETEWREYRKGKLQDKPPMPENIPTNPNRAYKNEGWVGMGDWLGTGTVAWRYHKCRPFQEARAFVNKLELKSVKEWSQYCKGEFQEKLVKPDDIPTNPNQAYEEKDWAGWGDWLGTRAVAARLREYRPFQEARAFVHKLQLASQTDWFSYCKEELPDNPPKPKDIPQQPSRTYEDRGWVNWGDWLGTGSVASFLREYLPFAAARAFVHGLELKSETEWRQYCKGKLPGKPPKSDDIPGSPNTVYKNEGWVGMGDWLGTGAVAWRYYKCRPFKEARTFVHKLALKSGAEWFQYCKGNFMGKPPKPEDIPTDARQAYKNEGWMGMGDWLGTGNVAPRLRKFRPFPEARAFVKEFGLRSVDEWKRYCKGELPNKPVKPKDIPTNPNQTYKEDGWESWTDWLGKPSHLTFPKARAFVHALNLKSEKEWHQYCKGQLPGRQPKPDEIPANPRRPYKDNGWAGMRDWLGTEPKDK